MRIYFYSRYIIMVFDSLSESGFFELEKYLNTNPYREYAMSKPYVPKSVPISAHSNRLHNKKKSSLVALHQLLTNRKGSLTLDRVTYKLRMKSDLNVDTLRNTPTCRSQNHPDHSHGKSHNHTNSNVNDRNSSIPPSSVTKTYTRQPTAITTKTVVHDKFHGIQGNAVHVGTLSDLIKQSHHEELRLFRRSIECLDKLSTCVPNNRLNNERPVSKPSSWTPERTLKQPQALTEYQFNVPVLPRTPSQVHRYRTKEKVYSANPPRLNDQRSNLLERQSTAMTSHDKRIQQSREKTLSHIEKQVCACNKLTIIDPFYSEQNEITLPLSKQASSRYIFPPVRPFGYFTKKSTDDILHLSPIAFKPKYQIPKKQQQLTKDSFESLDQVPIDDGDDDNSQLINVMVKSSASLTDLEDDSQNPPNAKIDFDLKQDKK